MPSIDLDEFTDIEELKMALFNISRQDELASITLDGRVLFILVPPSRLALSITDQPKARADG